MWNDKETNIDLLGHEKIARTILEIIGDNHLRPLTIGVYGDWGVGKSSILTILQETVLASDSKGKKGEKAHCIMFNGWLFQGYEDAKSSLMQTIISDLVKLQPKNQKILRLAKSLLKRINWLKVAKLSAGALWTAVSGLPDPTMLHGAAGIAKNFKDLTQPDQAKVEVELTEESIFKENENSTTEQVNAFRKEFKELIENSEINRLIVLVDDLDRCLPKAVIETLEAIRLFLFVEGTIFVVSADEKMIEYAVRDHFPNLPLTYKDYTKNYLEKLIQIPIRIPSLNRLQTSNYIRFLLLQHHLGHDYSRVREIYEIFEKKKKTPYDNVELDYQLITEAFGSSPPQLQKTLLVADQLAPTLANGLKGNPRNIKRFLNTLFLRQRIAKIYGLEDKIQLDVLAKLMILERFQNSKFEILIQEVFVSEGGISKTIEKGEKDSIQRKGPQVSSKEQDEFDIWIALKPAFAEVDLRPYVFISKEKAIGYDQDNELSENLSELLLKLNSGTLTNLGQAEKELSNIPFANASILFDRLENECRSLSDLKKQPNQMKGLYRIVKVHKQLEIRLVELLKSFPADSLNVWAISESSGLTIPDAKKKFVELVLSWSQQDENLPLKKLATQTLK